MWLKDEKMALVEWIGNRKFYLFTYIFNVNTIHINNVVKACYSPGVAWRDQLKKYDIYICFHFRHIFLLYTCFLRNPQNLKSQTLTSKKWGGHSLGHVYPIRFTSATFYIIVKIWTEIEHFYCILQISRSMQCIYLDSLHYE